MRLIIIKTRVCAFYNFYDMYLLPNFKVNDQGKWKCVNCDLFPAEKQKCFYYVYLTEIYYYKPSFESFFEWYVK